MLNIHAHTFTHIHTYKDTSSIWTKWKITIYIGFRHTQNHELKSSKAIIIKATWKYVIFLSFTGRSLLTNLTLAGDALIIQRRPLSTRRVDSTQVVAALRKGSIPQSSADVGVGGVQGHTWVIRTPGTAVPRDPLRGGAMHRWTL